MRKTCTCILSMAIVINLMAGETTGVYKRYSGNINKKLLITMELMITDSAVSGHYYYNKSGESIWLSGVRKQGTVNLTENHDTLVSGYFTGKLSADLSVFDGTWSDASHTKSYPFQLQAFLSEGSVELGSLGKSFEYVWKKNSKGQPIGCTAYYTFCYVSGMADKAAQKKINGYLVDAELDGNESTDNLKKITEVTMNDNFETFVESYEEVYGELVSDEHKKQMDETPGAYTWDQQVIASVMYDEDHLLCIRQQMYQFTGGAHGNYGYGFQTFDLHTGEALTLDDLIQAGTRPDLAAILEQQLRKDHDLNTDEPLTNGGFLVEKLELNDNFYINKAGIGFIYNPYEIASYADGAINIFLKWDQVQTLVYTEGPLSWIK